MKRKNDRLVALLGAVLCVCACLAGCERKETVSPEPPAPAVTNAPAAKQAASRVDDAAYQAKLKDRFAVQRRTREERRTIQAQIARLRARAKKALPANATEAQVTAEIENNPRKYPGWQEQNEALTQNDEKIKREEAATYTMVRRGILREAAGQTSAKQ